MKASQKSAILKIGLASVSLIFLSAIIYNSLKTVEKFETCDKPESSEADIINALGSTAQEACNKISSRAEEIEAQGEAMGKSLANMPWVSLFNPNNYKAGDNTSEDIMRNIINTDLSSCEVTRIHNTCNNGMSLDMVNSISNVNCPGMTTLYEQGIVPEIKNVTQKNLADIQQQCYMSTSVEALLQKKSSVDAQALAKVIQKAEGLLSGSNEVVKENCNVISNDLSSKSYIEDIGSCSNLLTVSQENSIEFCGNVTGIIQENNYKNFQSCLKDVDLKYETSLEGEVAVKQETEVEQTSIGGLIGSIVSLVLCIICLILIVYLSKSKGASAKTPSDFPVPPEYIKYFPAPK